jgi:hypothetical protein
VEALRSAELAGEFNPPTYVVGQTVEYELNGHRIRARVASKSVVGVVELVAEYLGKRVRIRIQEPQELQAA